MKMRTSVLVVAAAVAASWVLPGVRPDGSPRAGHEFLIEAAQAAPAQPALPRLEPMQLALLFQINSR